MVFFGTPRPIQRAPRSWRSFVLFALIATILTSSFVAVLTPALDATAKPASDMSIDEQLRSFTYTRTLADCFDKKGKPQGVNLEVSSWFDKNSTGYVYPDTTAEVSCSDIASKALDLWGYGGDTAKFLTDIGYVKTGLNYASKATKAGLKANLINNISYKIHASGVAPTNESEISQAARYILYANTFNAHCSPQYLGDAAKLTGDNKSKVASNATEEQDGKRYAYRTMNTVSDDGTRVTEGLRYARDDLGSSSTVNGTITEGRSNPIKVILFGYKSSQAITTCKQLSDDMWSNIDAFIKYRKNHPDEPLPVGARTSCTGDNCAAGEAKSTCQIDGIGWIVCPIVMFTANLVDEAYKVVTDLLDVQPIMTTGDTKAIYDAWAMMRNFANVAFVISFLVIIFSQLTSLGVSNYGIKKLLPKIIMAAILVNVSYWICAIAVDVSNILGSSLKAIFDGLNNNILLPEGGSFSGSNPWVNAAGVMLVGGTALYVGLSAFLPALVAALVAIVTVFIVLTLRQALIILLIVIAPLAFVALLLPNTEGWFKKWRTLLQTLLLMYPIIAAIFGVSALASKIVMASAGDNIAIQVMGAAISILPLAITPVVMKTAGGLLNRFGGMVNNPNKGPFDRMKKGADSIRNRQQDRRAIRSMNNGRVFGGGGQFRRQAKRQAIDTNLKRERSNKEQEYVAESAIRHGKDGKQMTDANGIPIASNFARQLAGGTGPWGAGADAIAVQSALANASITLDEVIAKEVKAEAALISNLDANALKGVLASAGSSDARKAASIQELVKISDPADYQNEVKDGINSDSVVIRQATAAALKESGPDWMKASDLRGIGTGETREKNLLIQQHNAANGTNFEEISLATIARDNAEAGVVSAEQGATMNKGDWKFIYDSANDGGKAVLSSTASDIKADPKLRTKIRHNRDAIDAVDANITTARTPVVMQQKIDVDLTTGTVTGGTTSANSTILNV